MENGKQNPEQHLYQMKMSQVSLAGQNHDGLSVSEAVLEPARIFLTGGVYHGPPAIDTIAFNAFIAIRSQRCKPNKRKDDQCGSFHCFITFLSCKSMRSQVQSSPLNPATPKLGLMRIHVDFRDSYIPTSQAMMTTR